MNAWNKPNFYAQVANIFCGTAVDAEALSENLLTHDFLHQLVISSANLLRCVFFSKDFQKLSFYFFHVRIRCVVALLLSSNGEQLAKLLLCLACDRIIDLIRISWEQRKFLGLFPSSFGQTSLRFTQRFDEWLRCFQACCNGGFLRRWCTLGNALVHVHASACLDHHDGHISDVLALFFPVDNATGNDHFKKCALVLLSIRECHPLALGVLVIS